MPGFKVFRFKHLPFFNGPRLTGIDTSAVPDPNRREMVRSLKESNYSQSLNKSGIFA